MIANATNDAENQEDCPVGSLLTKGAVFLVFYSAPARVQTARRAGCCIVTAYKLIEPGITKLE